MVMQIQATPPQQMIARTAPARAAAPAQPASAQGRVSPSSIANRMVAAPEALPLSAIPTDWVPMGTSQRRVDTRTGPIVLERGNVRINRSATQISVQQIDNRDLAGITLRVDPRDPSRMVAQTAVGTFRGRLTGGGDEYQFRADDGRHSIDIERHDDRVRFQTHGFGVIDAGRLNVYDR